MANAYSEAHVNNNFIPTVNLGLINTVLASKEQKYNANVAKIDAVIETYAKTDLLRDKDKQMMYENINNVISNFDGVSKMSLTNTDTMRQIEQSFSTAVTPYLVEQMTNTAKVRKFYGDLSKLKEKNPDKYHELNANFAIAKSGLSEYMSGEKDTIGNLEYKDYTDVMAKIQPQLDNYAKNYGFQNFHEMQGIADNPYQVREVNGKRLTKESIKTFVNGVIGSDPELIQQLEINAWGKYGGMSDEDFDKSFRDKNKQDSTIYAGGIAQAETEQKGYTKGTTKYEELQAQIDFMKNKKTEADNIANSTEKLNRDMVATKIYTDELSNNLANIFSYDHIDSVKYSDSPMKIAREFQREEIEFGMKQEEFLMKQEKHGWERNVAQGKNADGTEAGITSSKEVGDTGTESDKSAYSLATENYNKNYEGVRLAMLSTDKDFGAKSKTEQDAIISALVDSDSSSKTVLDGKAGNINQYASSVKDAVNKAKTDKKLINDYTNKIEVDYKAEVEEVYNQMLNRGNSRLNIDNMKGVPTFKANIKAGKTYNSLTDVEKEAITYEYLRNVRANGVTSDAQEKERLSIGEKVYREKLNKRKLTNTKYFEGLDSTYRNRGKHTGHAVTLQAEAILNGLIGIGAEFVEDLGDTTVGLFQGQEALRRRRATPTVNQFFNRAESLSNQAKTNVKDFFTSDESFADLSMGDVVFSIKNDDGTTTNSNYEGYYANKINTRNNQYKTILGSYGSNVGTQTNVSFTSDQKQNIPYINDIKAVVEAQEGRKIAPESTYNYTYNRDTNKYEIEVTLMEKQQREGKDTFQNVYEKKVVEVDPSQMTSRLIQRLNPTNMNFSQSVHNPNRETETVTVTQPTTATIKNNFINKITELHGQALPSADLSEFKTQMSQFFRTPTERLNSVDNLISSEKQRQELNNLYNTTFDVRYVGSIEEGYTPIITGEVNGKEVYSESLGRISNEDIKTSADKTMTTAYLVDYYINDKQTKILAKNER